MLWSERKLGDSTCQMWWGRRSRDHDRVLLQKPGAACLRTVPVIGVLRMMGMGSSEGRQFEVVLLIVNVGRMRELVPTGQRKQQK